MTAIFQMLACVVVLASAIPTAIATAKREARPRIATWFILVVFNAVLGGVALGNGEQVTAVFALSATVGATLVLVLALATKPRPYGTADAACQALACLFMALILLTEDPQRTVATVMVVAIGLLSALPAVYYQLRSQSDEFWGTYLGYAMAAGIMLAVTDRGDFFAIMLPLFMFSNGGATALLLLGTWLRTRAVHKAATS
ncbi:MAG TPA: hypothetical protein VFO38_06010 [Candidatus Saccharimonadales bacterium]|nr:hypothetical protein [Candidatus Saccharimonadales bacterium]